MSAGTCNCCDEPFQEEIHKDPDIGNVCGDCLWRLKAVRNDLYTISQEQQKNNEQN